MISRPSRSLRLTLKVNFRAAALLAVVALQLWVSQGAHAQTMLEENCRSCHTVARTGMSLSGFAGMTNLGAGTFKVFTVVPGQVASIGIDVTDGHDRYALSLSKLGIGGANDSNNHLVYQLDPNWLNHTTFFTSRTLTTNQQLTYNLDVKTNTPPDFYLLNMDLGGISDSGSVEWDQFEQFYVQVISTNPPVAQILNPVLNDHIFSISVPTVTGFTYHLEYTDFASNPSWNPIGQVAGDGNVQVLSDSTATVSLRFYRVRID